MRAALHQNDVAQVIGGPPRLALEDIIRHPRLPEARKVYLDRFLDVYDGDPFLVRLLIETGRFSLFILAAALEAAQDPARRDTWLTIGRLKEAMASFGRGSGRHVDQLIGRLCAVGFMEQRPAEQDRRVRILKVTEKMWAHDREWLAAHFAPLAACYPQHDYGPALRSDRRLHTELRRASANPAILSLGAKLMLSVPDMALFLAHAGGFMVIAALLQAALATADHAHAAVPYADIGDRFGISRTHVRRLLNDAEAAGLVKLHARGGRRVELLPRLWASFDRAMSTGMYFHDILYVAATGRRDSAAGGNVLRLA
jgi:DNA-binding MarR family transcriptional regulator